jgi:hypothetical protein
MFHVSVASGTSCERVMGVVDAVNEQVAVVYHVDIDYG